MSDPQVGQVWHEYRNLSMDDDGRLMRVTAIANGFVSLESVFAAAGLRTEGRRNRTNLSVSKLLRNWRSRGAPTMSPVLAFTTGAATTTLWLTFWDKTRGGSERARGANRRLTPQGSRVRSEQQFQGTGTVLIVERGIPR